MHRRRLIGWGFAALTAACTRAYSSSSDIQTIESPQDYAESLARRIAAEGMTPIRETFTQFGQTTTDLATMEGTFALFERGINGREASRWNEIEDIALRDELRTIYYLHVYDARTVLFTRFDFARNGVRTWSLIGLTFGSQWNQVAVPITSGFTNQN